MHRRISSSRKTPRRRRSYYLNSRRYRGGTGDDEKKQEQQRDDEDDVLALPQRTEAEKATKRKVKSLIRQYQLLTYEGRELDPDSPRFELLSSKAHRVRESLRKLGTEIPDQHSMYYNAAGQPERARTASRVQFPSHPRVAFFEPQTTPRPFRKKRSSIAEIERHRREMQNALWDALKEPTWYGGARNRRRRQTGWYF